MKFADYLKNCKIDAQVKTLMTPGLAVEFIQPWYTPLSTTPSSTGIAVGGIGSTFTVTPAGTTPVMNVVPGVQVRAEKPEDIRLNNFFFRESVVEKNPALKVASLANFNIKDGKYTLKNAKGEPLFSGCTTVEDAEARLNKAASDKKFYATNAENFARWNIEWSDRTTAMLASGDTTSANLNRALLTDFFDGCVGLEVKRAGALTAAWGNETEFLGQAGFDASKMQYRALYPVSETTYKGEGVQITKNQFSYVIPNDERLSSLPVSATEFVLENTTKETREITIAQIQDSLTGYQVRKDRQGVQDSSFVMVPVARNPKGVRFDLTAEDGRAVRGVEFYNEERLAESDFDGCMSVSAAWDPKDNLNVSVKPIFYQDDAAATLKEALASGRVSKTFVKNVYSGRETIACAVVVTAVLKPKSKVSFQFNTVLDFPQIRLNGMSSLKKYTVFYPEAFGRTRNILLEALKNDERMKNDAPKIYSDLVPAATLSKISPKHSDNLKSLALNTLSFLAEATVWDKEDRFLVRECADYPFFNSLDVYFYGSFSLLNLMPRLDGAVMLRFADAILAVDENRRRHHEFVNHPFADLPDPKLEGPRAVYGAVIHDLGSPFDAKPDAYDWHNVKEWKDLAPKFVLMVLRHYRHTGNISVLQGCREAVYACMEYLERMVGEGQAFPLTHGTDDTFDNLSSHGISVYCGSLWIAGLRAAAAIAEILGDHDRATDWNAKSEVAAEEFHSALWDETEGYFHFFVTPIEAKDIKDEFLDTLRKKLEGTLELPENKIDVVACLNDWLNSSDVPEDVELSRKELRGFKKEWLYGTCPKAFNDSFKAKLDLDNDDVFADAMLADTYLRLLDLSPLTDSEKAKRTLKRIFDTNYKKNSSLIGAANLVHKDGEPLDEFNFQAHDVWIGIQYSIASAMEFHGLKDEASDIIDSMVRNLYDEARIPFAAPEGFNGSCRLHPEALVKAFGLKEAAAKKLHKSLVTGKALLADSRISPTLPRTLPLFTKAYGSLAKANKIDCEKLFMLLHSTALKYTAGKYFRPGMIFAVLEAAEK